MESLYIKPIPQNYGSLDYSPQTKHRPLTDLINFGNYSIYKIFNHKFIILGPHWPIFIAAYIGFTCASFYMVKTLHSQDKNYTLALIISIIQGLTYLLIGLISDPGLSNNTDLNNQYLGQLYNIPQCPQNNGVWYCYYCQLIQPAKAGHCQFCKICIQGFDHHCPWTGKCIGKNNMVYFILFILSTMLYFSYFIFMYTD